MNERIRPPRNFEGLLDSLKTDGIFDTKQKGMMFAAALGAWLCRKGEELPNLDRKGEGIRLEYFQSVGDDGFIDALAVTQAGTLSVVGPEATEERIELFERFALLGLTHIDKILDGGSRKPLEVVIELLARIDAKPEGALPGLEDLEGAIFG